MRKFVCGLGMVLTVIGAPMALADPYEPATIDSFGSGWSKQIRASYNEHADGFASDGDTLSPARIHKIRRAYAQHMGVPHNPVLLFLSAELEQ